MMVFNFRLLALPGKPGDPVPQSSDKPRFDFYKILPGNSEAIPDPKPAEGKSGEPKQADGTKGKDGTEAALKEPVYLQTGSFQNASDADNQKAKLAIQGFTAKVMEREQNGRTVYRVRLGPSDTREAAEELQRKIEGAGFEANLVRVQR
jgi:cell division protein FtsN